MRWLRGVLLVCAAMSRSNFVVALACLFLVLLLFRPRGWRDLLLDLVPAVTASAVFYRLFYSSYPGSGLNYLLSAVYQGIDYAQPMGVELARGVLGINDDMEERKYRACDMGFSVFVAPTERAVVVTMCWTPMN